MLKKNLPVMKPIGNTGENVSNENLDETQYRLVESTKRF